MGHNLLFPVYLVYSIGRIWLCQVELYKCFMGTVKSN